MQTRTFVLGGLALFILVTSTLLYTYYFYFPTYTKDPTTFFIPGLDELRSAPLDWNYTFEDGWNAEYTRCSWSGRNENAQVWRFAQMQSERAGEVISDPRDPTNRVMKFEWSKELGKTCDGNTQKKAHLFGESRASSSNEEFWSFDVYFPSEGMRNDSQPEILIQWHDEPDKDCWHPSCEYPRNPPLTIENKYDQLIVSWIYDPRTHTPPAFTHWDRQTVDIGVTPKDQWVTFETYIQWDPFGHSVLRLWKNGELVVDKTNMALGFNDDSTPYVGIGIYKYTGDSDYDARMVYFDNVKQAILN